MFIGDLRLYDGNDEGGGPNMVAVTGTTEIGGGERLPRRAIGADVDIVLL